MNIIPIEGEMGEKELGIKDADRNIIIEQVNN